MARTGRAEAASPPPETGTFVERERRKGGANSGSSVASRQLLRKGFVLDLPGGWLSPHGSRIYTISAGGLAGARAFGYTGTGGFRREGIIETAAAAPGRLIACSQHAEVYAWDERLLVKLPRAGFEHRVPLEEANTRAVQDGGLPVRRVAGRVRVRGREGLLLERLRGVALQEALVRNPLRLGRAARVLAETHAALHAREAPGLPPLRPELEFYVRAAPLPTGVRDALLRRMASLPWEERVCHADFHPGNLLLTQNGPVVIDWTAAVRGPPLYDVAKTTLLLDFGSTPPSAAPRRLVRGFRRALRVLYLHRYFRLRPGGRGELAAWRALAAARLLAEGWPEAGEGLCRAARVAL